jgi:hypothetical protein
MAITFVSSGAAVNTVTTTLSLVAGALAASDILIANILTHDNVAITGQDSRWQTIHSANNTAALRDTVYWMIAAAGDSLATFNFTITGTTAGLGRLTAYRGAFGVGTVTASVNASSATVTWATLTPSNAANIILATAAIALQTGSDGGVSAGTPTFTNQYYSAGTTDAIVLYDALIPAGVPTGARTMNNTNAAVNTGVFFELLGTQPGGGGGGYGGGTPPLSRKQDMTQQRGLIMGSRQR